MLNSNRKNQKIVLIPLVIQLGLFAVMLFLDLRLVDWYEQFYMAIQGKSADQFFFQLAIYIIITLSQALILGLLSLNSDIYEAKLKIFFSERWAKDNLLVINFGAEKTMLDQRIIDDSALAAEKVAVVFPTVIFNLCKALLFLGLLSTHPSNLSATLNLDMPVLDSYGLSVFGVLYLLLQFSIVKLANKWVFKSEKIKRMIEAKTRYKLIGKCVSSMSLIKIVEGYVGKVAKIRFAVGKAHGINVAIINSISSLSFLVPFFIFFSAYSTGLITFGELMKISATYSGFQMSALYVLNTYRDGYRGLAALKRLAIRII